MSQFFPTFFLFVNSGLLLATKRCCILSLPVNFSTFWLWQELKESLCPSVHLSIHLFVRLFVCLFVCWFVRSFGSNLSRALTLHLSSSNLQAIRQQSVSSQSVVIYQSSYHRSLKYFVLLTSRTVNYNHLCGVIFNFACGLHQYIPNREPAHFETVQFLVDGSHWNGHSSCSNGYNFDQYKPYTAKNNCENSQNREQLHSTLSKLGKSLRQMSYQNFMQYLKAFFAISNITKLHKI